MYILAELSAINKSIFIANKRNFAIATYCPIWMQVVKNIFDIVSDLDTDAHGTQKLNSGLFKHFRVNTSISTHFM